MSDLKPAGPSKPWIPERNLQETAPQISLEEIARTFFVIGATGFGGGMAIIALIQDTCVRRKKWLATEEFAHGVAFGQLLGAFAVNVSTFIGYRLRGFAGAIVAVGAFLAPSVTMVIVLSALYFRLHHIPALQSALRGIGPVVVALIVSAAFQMGRGKMRGAEPVLIALAALLLSLLAHAPILVILLLASAQGAIRYAASERRKRHEN
jgi:chromate transporter